jgi:hypothetical protein
LFLAFLGSSEDELNALPSFFAVSILIVFPVKERACNCGNPRAPRAARPLQRDSNPLLDMLQKLKSSVLRAACPR